VLLALGAERLPRAVAARHRRASASPYASAAVVEAAVELTPPQVGWARERGPLVRELARQAFHTSMPALLRYADRNSMAHSREVRLPFLDRRIAELALSLPPGLVYGDGTTKRVIRDAVRDVVPDRVLARRDKVGFETPEARWLATPRAIGQIREALLGDDALSAELLDRPALAADVRAGRWRDSNGVWRALNLELWLRAFARA
jgi:asparagine synthase (glutamine-hydrolysing)